MADDSLSVTYTKNRRIADKAELDAWVQDQLAQPAKAATPAATPAPSKPAEKPNPLTAGAEAVGESVVEGFKKLTGQTPPTGVGPIAAAKNVFDGLFQMTLGAAGAGAGKTVRQLAENNLPPGWADTTVLKGGAGGPATLARMMLGSLAKTEGERKALQADMTAGEALDIATSLATVIYGPKLLSRGKGAAEAPGKAGAPLEGEVVEPGAGQPRALPERTPIRAEVIPAERGPIPQPGETQKALPPAPQPRPLPPGVYEMPGDMPIEAPTPESVAARLQVLSEQLRQPEPPKVEQVAREVESEVGKAVTPEDLNGAGTAAAVFADESGKIDTGLLARMAIGFGAGCATGEDAEDCIKRGLVGMGVGAALSTKVAKAVGNTVAGRFAKNPEATREGGRSGVSVQASEQPYQPNYQRLDLTPAVKNVMVNVHRSLKDDILARRGPAKSNEATVVEAIRRIETGKMTPERVLTVGDEEMLTREDLTAARILTTRAFEHVVELRDRILKGETLPPGEYATARAVAGAMGRNTRVAQTRIAQAQQASSIRIGGESVKYTADDVAHLADLQTAGLTDQQLAVLDSAIKTPEQMGRAMTFLSVFPRAFLQGMYFSYLSGKAAVRNLVGNSTMLGINPIDRGIGRFMPTWGDTRPRILPGEATQMVWATGEALVDQVRMAGHLDEIQAAANKVGVGGGVLKSERRSTSGFRDLAETISDEGSALRTWGDWLDKITTFTSEVLDRTDLATKTIAGRMQMRVEAMRQAVSEGHRDAALEQRIAAIMDDVTQLSPSARQRIVNLSEETTFTKQFESNLLQALAKGPDNEWVNLAYRGAVMPFFRVAARMAEQGMLRTPGLNFLASQFYRDWAAGGAQRQIAQARVVGGAAVIGAFMYLESQGLVTGNAPTDPKLARLWRDAGYQERSFWDPVSGKWRSYDGLGPLTTLVSTGADASLTIRKLPESDATHVMLAAVLSQINNLDSRTFTQSLSHLMEVMKNPGPDSQVERAMTFLRKQVAGWLRPGVAREVESLVDPERRRAMPSGAYDNPLAREFHAMLDEVRSGWPGFSSAKDAEGNFLVPPDRHPITGEPTIVETWPFNPFTGKTPKDIPVTIDGRQTGVMAEIIRLNGAGINPLPEWIGGSNPGADAGFAPENLRQGIRLTPQARDRWVELMTQGVKDEYGHTYAQALKATMEEPVYALQSDGLRGTDGGKAKFLQAVEEKFRTMAEDKLYEEAPKLHRKVLARQAERAIQQTPTKQQPEARDAVNRLLDTLGR